MSISKTNQNVLKVQSLVVGVCVGLVLIVTGCASPIGSMPALKQLPESISVRGSNKLAGREVVIDDIEKIDQIVSLIGSIRGVKHSRYSFNPRNIESLKLTLHYDGEDTSLTMAFGRMAVPNIDDTLFYGDKETEQEQLWDLLKQELPDPGGNK